MRSFVYHSKCGTENKQEGGLHEHATWLDGSQRQAETQLTDELHHKLLKLYKADWEICLYTLDNGWQTHSNKLLAVYQFYNEAVRQNRDYKKEIWAICGIYLNTCAQQGRKAASHPCDLLLFLVSACAKGHKRSKADKGPKGGSGAKGSFSDRKNPSSLVQKRSAILDLQPDTNSRVVTNRAGKTNKREGNKQASLSCRPPKR